MKKIKIMVVKYVEYIHLVILIMPVLVSLPFLFIGLTKISAENIVDKLKPDFSNLSKDKLVSVVIDDVEDTLSKYKQVRRRSITSYNYFIIKVFNKKLILESTDSEIKKGSVIRYK